MRLCEQSFAKIDQEHEMSSSKADQPSLLTKSLEAAIHNFAYSCYQNGLFEKATAMFQYLTTFRPNDARYWFGLGSALLMQERVREAEQAFRLASLHNVSDPKALAFRSECLHRLGESAKAQTLLAEAEKLCQLQPNHPCRKQIELVKERIVTTSC
jgi:Flp pilus assembly protein TadD